MHLQEQRIVAAHDGVHDIEVHALQGAAMLAGATTAGAVHQNPAHDFKSDSVELLPIFPIRA